MGSWNKRKGSDLVTLTGKVQTENFPYHLEKDQEGRVRRSDVPHFNHVWTFTDLLKLCNLEATQHLALLLGHGLLSITCGREGACDA